MSSTYAPLPFSYLAGGSQPPKTGFRRDDGLYGSRRDMAQPIPALRHDQPRLASDWSIDQRLRGGDLSPKPERRRQTPHDSGDTESVLSHCSDVRQPRPDVSLYQSQIAGPTFGSSALMVDTPSGHYSNRASNDVDDAGHVDDKPPPTAVKPHGAVGVFDNFILKGPGVQRSRTDAGARRTEDERPTPTSRLEQLFDDRSSSSDAAPTRRRDSETAVSRPAHTLENAARCDDDTQLPPADETINNSYIVTTSRSTSFCIGDTKLMERSSATDSETACTQCCCGSSRAVYCSRCRLCVLVGTAVFVALLMCGIGFVAGWFAYEQLQHHPADGSLAAEGNATASTGPGRTESLTTVVTAATSTSSSATTSAANSTTAPVSQPNPTNATTATTTTSTTNHSSVTT